MGNCAGRPKTSESDVPVPEPVTEEVKVEQQAEETKAEETVEVSEEKSLSTLLNEVCFVYCSIFHYYRKKS
jgi:hypothetical protein